MAYRPIYVEIHLHSSLEDVWRLTQTPDLHTRWDMRFNDIEYLPRSEDSQPQRFYYRTRIGFGLNISGEGESLGRHETSGERTSSLKFWSSDRKSLIREGSGYWKYIQTDDGLRFLTQYDYRTRFGFPGRWLDALVFRPLLGWATAWSFDRLRLWLEKGIAPEISWERSAIHAVARITLALIWIYQGAIPKVLFPDSRELEQLRGYSLFSGWEQMALLCLGWVEIIFGFLLILLWSKRTLFVINALLLGVLLCGAAVSSPSILKAPFNPLTLSLGMIALCLTGYWSSRELPSSRRCFRRPQSERS